MPTATSTGTRRTARTAGGGAVHRWGQHPVTAQERAGNHDLTLVTLCYLLILPLFLQTQRALHGAHMLTVSATAPVGSERQHHLKGALR